MMDQRNQREGIEGENSTDEDSVAQNEGEEKERRSMQSPRTERSELNHTTDSRNGSVCSFCKGNKTVVAFSLENRDQKMHCRSCGEEFVGSADDPGSALLEEPAATAVNVVDLNNLPNIPYDLLDDLCSGRSLSNASPAVCFSNQKFHRLKTPRQGDCNFTKSLQVPGQTTPATLFLIEQTHVDRSENLFFLCFVPSQEVAQVYEIISAREHEGIIHPLTDESSPGFENHFHEIMMLPDDQVTVSFQLTHEFQRKFRIRYPLAENVISLYDVQSRCHYRICPGARVHLCVECTGDPRELCQGRIRITVANAAGTRNMIFSILAFGPTN